MLHGGHHEDSTVGTKWTLIDATPLLDWVYTMQRRINYVYAINEIFASFYDRRAITNKNLGVFFYFCVDQNFDARRPRN